MSIRLTTNPGKKRNNSILYKYWRIIILIENYNEFLFFTLDSFSVESTSTSRPRTRPTRHMSRPYFLRRSGGWGTASQTLGEQILQIRCTYYGSLLNTRAVALVHNWSKGDSKRAVYWWTNRMAKTGRSYVLTNRKVEISCLQQ